jgi:hypothetical protein
MRRTGNDEVRRLDVPLGVGAVPAVWGAVGMRDDLVTRLRRTRLSAPDIQGGVRQVPLNPDGLEAADEIERLRAALTLPYKEEKDG